MGLHNFQGEAQILIGIALGILVLASTIFFTWKKLKPEANLDELIARTNSWWIIFIVVTGSLYLGKGVTILMIGLLSFFALREFLSVVPVNVIDRRAMLWCYLAIPIQFYAIYIEYYPFFISWIPVGMFVILSMRKVAIAETEKYTESLAILYFSLILIVYSLGHFAYLRVIELPVGHEHKNTSLILYLLFLTQFNDVLQFIWGKMLGKNKIIPKVSPNKTWEGFIGGLVCTMIFGYCLRFLTHFTPVQAVVISFVIAFCGFFGDLNISAIKRDMRIKDMGNSIPGHGGYMDRIDSLSFSSLAFFHLINIWGRFSS